MPTAPPQKKTMYQQRRGGCLGHKCSKLDGGGGQLGEGGRAPRGLEATEVAGVWNSLARWEGAALSGGGSLEGSLRRGSGGLPLMSAPACSLAKMASSIVTSGGTSGLSRPAFPSH